MYADEQYNEAEKDVIRRVEEDIDDVQNGRPARRRAYVSRAEGGRLDVNISTKNTNQKLNRLPLTILGRVYNNLLRIDLSGNDLGISGLPPQFEKCESLYYLKLEYCNLTKIPDVICRLHSLVVLDIRHNKIDHLPNALQDLRHLRVLFLPYNHFKELPTFLTQFASLKTIDVTGNPLEAPPRVIWDDTLPQNHGLAGLEKTRRILQWLEERKSRTNSSGDMNSMEPIRPGSLVPRPLNLSKPHPSPQPSTTSNTRSNIPNRSGSMDTTFSEAVTDAPDITLHGSHAAYVARKIGKAYYQLVQHMVAELKVADASGSGSGAGAELATALRALDECARDLMALDAQDSGTDRMKAAVLCGSQLLSDVLRAFVEDIAVNAEDDLIEDMPTLFGMVDKNITSALQDVGVRFESGSGVGRVASLFQIAPYGTVNFAYSGQPQAGAVAVRVPDFRVTYQPSEAPTSTLSYSNSVMSSTADLQQAVRVEDAPYELVGEVIGNCTFIKQQLQELLALGHMQSAPAVVHSLWTEAVTTVEYLDHKAQILHEQLANFSATDIANLREPFVALADAVVKLLKMLKRLSKAGSYAYVSEPMLAACNAIKVSVTTAMRLLNGARSSAITPTSTVIVTGAGSTGSYAPTTPLNAALGPAAARMVGKDTSSLFRKIDDLQRKERRF